MAQHESAAAHITATNELRGEEKPVAEDFEQGIGVLGAGDTAEKHVRTRCLRVLVDELCGLEQGVAEGRIPFVDSDFGGGSKLGRIDDLARRKQACAGHHDERRGKARRWGFEGGCVGHFSSKIQAADERVDFADGGGAGAEFLRESEIGTVAEQHGVARTASLGRRKEEDSMRRDVHVAGEDSSAR